MINASVRDKIQIPVRRSSRSGVGELVFIDVPEEMDDWQEDVSGCISEEGMAVIQKFLGAQPKIVGYSLIDRTSVPNLHDFYLSSTPRGVKFVLRIRQYDGGDNGNAGVVVFVNEGKHPKGFSFSSGEASSIKWLGIKHGELLIATQLGFIFRVLRQRDRKKIKRGRFWEFSEVKGFRIEILSTQDHINI